MKTEPIKIIVTEPGYGFVPATSLCDTGTERELPAIDPKGNALPVGEYLCTPVLWQQDCFYNNQELGYCVSDSCLCQHKKEFNTVVAYQLIDDAVKDEKESKEFSYSRGTQIVTVGDLFKWDGVHPGIYEVVGFTNSNSYSPSGLGGTTGVLLKNENGEVDEWCGDSVASGIASGFIKNNNSTPVNEAKEVEDIRLAAKIIAQKQNAKLPFETSRPIDNFYNGFFLGAEWADYRATHPIENKEGVKSAEELLLSVASPRSLFRNSDNPNADKALNYLVLKEDAIKAIEAAQFTPIEHGKRMVDVETFQQRVNPWLLECFGQEIASDKKERNYRFIEEALELVQSIGCSKDEVLKMVDYVFNRDIGEPYQEVGGVMVTLAALCLANNLDMHQNAETELARIWTKVDKIRAKQVSKQVFGVTITQPNQQSK